MISRPIAQVTTNGRQRQAERAPLIAAGLSLGSLAGVRGVYVHIPFCFHKCHYCDFYSVVATQERQEAFVARLIEEIEAVGTGLDSPLETIFIGGGTPTLLRRALWRDLLTALRERLPMSPEVEFTVEANPETVSGELARQLAEGGVNRLSIGVQSFNHRHLKTLERWHDPENVGRAVEHARRAGIFDINLDLICAIPGQRIEDWLDDLDRALALEPQHVSCYTLMYEPNTPLTAKLQAGRIERVDEDLEAEMYEATIDVLDAAGFEHYEISNWARPGRECRHNLRYWTNADWWPLGPSAAGHVGGTRWKNTPHLGEYFAQRPWPPIVNHERLEENDRVGEALMLRLRLCAGIDRATLDGLLAGDHANRSERIDMLIEGGLLEWLDSRLRLTHRGLLLADTVFAELL